MNERQCVTGLLPCKLQSNHDLVKVARKLGIADALMDVVPKDEIPLVNHEVEFKGFIVNMMNAKEWDGTKWRDSDGSHWMLLWYLPTFSFYFDPVGHVPPLEVLYNARDSHKMPLYASPKNVQHFQSCQCGYYCLMMMWLLCNGYSTRAALAEFSDNPVENDIRLMEFFHRFGIDIGKPKDCRTHLK
jgi:hypothetical protein